MASKNPLHPIPHPPKKPIVGNLLSLSSATPAQDMAALAREYGEIYWLDMMGAPVVIASGYSLVNELCDEKRFDKNTRGFLRRLRGATHGLFTSDTKEPTWSKPHNILLPNFSQRAMQNYHPMMLDLAEQLVQKWERLNPDDEIDVVRDMTALTLDTIGLCGFGYRFNSFYREGFHPFVDAMVRTLETTQMLRGLPLEDLVLKKKRQQLARDTRYMHKVVEEIVRERRESGADISAKPDLLSYMISGVDKKTGERLDDRQIRDECIEFLIAGHETTSGLLSFTIYFLSNNPDVLAKATAEVDSVFGTDLSIKPTYAQVNRLGYIAQILKESLRLWPTAPAFSLCPYEDTTIGGQYEMKKRYIIFISTLALHRDKSVWGERAEVFDPDHFSHEAERARPANAYKPFGNGQRACIGRQFAMQEATLLLGMILQRFKLVDHTRYKLKVKETLTIKPEGLHVKVRLRTDADRGRVDAARMIADTKAKPVRKTVVAQHGTPLLVLFGSNLGTAEDFARRTAELGEAYGFATRLASLDDYAERLPATGAVAIVAASYNGVPTDNVAQFYRWLNDSNDSQNGIAYTVFGCGNSDWASTYQTVPRQIDERLEELGARRIHVRAEGDAREDIDGAFQTWVDSLWPAVASGLQLKLDFNAAVANEPLYTVEEAAPPQANSLVMSLGAAPLQVALNRELQRHDGATPSQRSTRHVELDLPEGVSYRAGDHLAIVPRNAEAQVERGMRRFGFANDSHVRLRTEGSRKTFLPVDEAVAVQRLLTDFVELQDVATRKHIGLLAEHTPCPATRPKLAALTDGDAYKSEVLTRRRSVLDLLEEFPACQVPFGVFLEMLPAMTPRYYSISSSPLTHPRRCSVTVGVVQGPARSGQGIFEGVCSNYVKRVDAGSVVHGIVKETTVGFRLPDDLKRPIIMIGPGTGLAPFRGFLQERFALKANDTELGEAMLFFGCRHPEQDYLYADELQAWENNGVMRLSVAFSRSGDQKTYVQDLLRKEAANVWRAIEAGAIVYVCGDGSRMEPDVRRALVDIGRTQGGLDEPAAEARLDRLAKEQRYVLDVWAGS